MTKKEIIWREILYQALERKVFKFTQQDLAKKFNYSVSTVFNALKVPRQSGAVKVTGRYFEVTDAEKLLIVWATFRRLEKEIIYQTRVNLPPEKITGLLPSEAVLTGYAGYQQRFGSAPADFDKVHVYAANPSAIKQRFPFQPGNPNLIVIKADDQLLDYSQLPLAQLYVDLWNFKDWQAKDFLAALTKKIL